jgi:hypothetical protein
MSLMASIADEIHVKCSSKSLKLPTGLLIDIVLGEVLVRMSFGFVVRAK